MKTDAVMGTVEMPALGDSVVWSVDGNKVICTVTAMIPRDANYPDVRPGGVRLVDTIGIRYSMHPTKWIERVMSGEIRKV